ncbi:MAG: nitroreductase [Victivallaceae bacterium]|nr:nitroreductase [Victivallaceae bacterium]
MNDVVQALCTRRSCRNFSGRMPSREVIDEILTAGTFAATGRGAQSPVIVAVSDPAVREKLRRANAAILGKDASFDPFYGAPLILIVLADRMRPTCLYDGTLVMGNLMIAAHALGLASCWIHRAKEEFDSPEGKAFLREIGIEGDYEGIGHCAIGYAAETLPEPAPRKQNYIYRVG